MRRTFLAAALLVAVLLPWGVSAGEPASYLVFRGDRPVLEVIDRPGPLVSTALLPAGASPTRHPFLSASALAPSEEHELRTILDGSSSTADFLKNLERAGYRVEAR